MTGVTLIEPVEKAADTFTDIGASRDAIAGDPGRAVVSEQTATESVGLRWTAGSSTDGAPA